MQGFIWNPREYDPERTEPMRIGWVPPVVGMHKDMPLVPARLALATDPDAKVIITAGQTFTPNNRWLEQFCKMNPDFRRA